MLGNRIVLPWSGDERTATFWWKVTSSLAVPRKRECDLARPVCSPHKLTATTAHAPPPPCPCSLTGPQVQDLGKQAVPATHTPLTVCNGVVGCRLKSGAMDNVTLESHKMLQPGDAVARAAPAKRFAAALKLYKLRDAVECAKQLRQVRAWQ